MVKGNWRYNSTKRDHTQMLNFIRSKEPFNRILNHKIYDNLLMLKSLRHQVDYYIIIPTEEELGGNEWYCESIETAFEIAYFIIQSFENYGLNN